MANRLFIKECEYIARSTLYWAIFVRVAGYVMLRAEYSRATTRNRGWIFCLGLLQTSPRAFGRVKVSIATQCEGLSSHCRSIDCFADILGWF